MFEKYDFMGPLSIERLQCLLLRFRDNLDIHNMYYIQMTLE